MNMLRLGVLTLLVLTVILFASVKIKDAMTDDTPPVIYAATDLLEISVTDGEDKLLHGMTATDRQDGDLTDKLMVAGVSQLITEDTAKITYVVFGLFSRYIEGDFGKIEVCSYTCSCRDMLPICYLVYEE